MTGRAWAPIVAKAAAIVESYSTGVTLRGLYDDALADWWDVSAYEDALAREATDLAELGHP